MATRNSVLPLLTCAAALAVTSPALASDIYKCRSGDAISYQSLPCARGQDEVRMTLGAAKPAPEPSAVAEPRPDAVAFNSTTRSPLPWRNRSLALGMSDDEVLNLPGWGRPSKITRVRLPRAWQEVWVYGSATAGERELKFRNARLAEIGDTTAPATQVALVIQ